MDQPLIFKQYKDLSKNIPWMPLGKFPTPVERLENLGKKLGLNNLWIKRDDLSGEIYGGNKVRTLEFSLAEATNKQADLIFTYSALGSNWPLACVIYAKLNGWPTDIIFFPKPLDSNKVKNLELTHQLARRVICTKSLLTFPFVFYIQMHKANRDARVYLTPPGGTSPLTTLGYVNAVFELKEQCEKGEAPIPDVIFCSLGSGGTAAGLSIGLNLIGWPTQVMAVRVVDFIVANKLTLNHLIRRTLELLQTHGVPSSSLKKWHNNFRIVHSYFGKGYSVPTPLGEKSIQLFKSEENQILDSTYTGKTFSAILDLAKENSLKNKNILFWQTLNSRSLENLLNILSEKNY
ncbi:MAG: 1-aminocyclopropane-1-carboxylate deaminase/D-cysteine desulfhydrase [bacterium]